MESLRAAILTSRSAFARKVFAGRLNRPLILLSQKVATFYVENQIFGGILNQQGAEMGLPRSNDGKARFSAYVEGLTSVIGHADRARPLRDYCLGLIMPGERKSVEPMAAITAPERTAAQHQSLLHFVGEGKWSDEKVLAQVREFVLPKMKRHGPIEAWIIDDTGFPKKGQHSVGVARQYCGELGKQDNCQVAVTLSIANRDASLPVAYQLYLPKDWASDRNRRHKVGIPDEISFKTKPEIALAQIRWACEAGLPRGVVLMDAGYGVDTDLRMNITALGLSYVAGIQSHTRQYGRLARGRGRQRNGWDAGVDLSCCAATTSTSRPRSRSLRLACRGVPGARSHGGKPRRRSCPRDLPACAFVSRIGTTGSPTAGRRNGC